MDVSIRKAKNQDLAAILEIVNYSIVNTTANYNYEPQSIEAQQLWFEHKLRENFPVIVAELDQKVVGYGTYGTFREKIGYQFTVEHSVYVGPGYVGKGIGKLILLELIALATENGFHTMIGGIDAANTDSIDFHKRFGFVECGIIKEAGFKFGRWLDLQFMQLLLK
ncbi:MAG TPA: GNAT family N-acetyltransferase [Flavobacterium sp.]|jgi:phosphinothricin acetyltransferase